VTQERQVYTVRAVLLRFTLASDGDIHLAIADPHNRAVTMIAEIPDPDRMTGAPERYRNQVAQTRRNFVAAFGAPALDIWRPVGRQVQVTGPIFFDYRAGPPGGEAGVAPNDVEIHPVLSIVPAGKTQDSLHHKQ